MPRVRSCCQKIWPSKRMVGRPLGRKPPLPPVSTFRTAFSAAGSQSSSMAARSKSFSVIPYLGRSSRKKSISHVLYPTMPSASSPFRFWKSTTALWVVLLNSWVGLWGMSSNVCKTSTSCPVLLYLIVFMIFYCF